jgi:hypothetical protein
MNYCFDRTAEDVENAKKIRKKIQSGLEISDSDIEILNKGTLTLEVINRIEKAQSDIKSDMESLGYYGASHIINKEWRDTDVFLKDDFERILRNLESLKIAFFVFYDTPLNPRPLYHYKEFNALEKILYDLQEMISYTKDKIRNCGTFNCGG